MNSAANKSGPSKTSSSRAESGAVMLEFVIAFPVVLVLMLACFQLAHLWIAKMVVHYAAFCAARSALVRPVGEYSAAGQQAAEQVCTNCMNYSILHQKSPPVFTDKPFLYVTAEVKADFSLVSPIVGPIIAWGLKPSDQTFPWWITTDGVTTSSPYPTITLTESVTLPKPYITMVTAGILPHYALGALSSGNPPIPWEIWP